jgi:hypothetical protein
VTQGTLFGDGRLELRQWMQAIWFVVCQKQGVNAMALQSKLHFGRYGTAWSWLRKIRQMMELARDTLRGKVEVGVISIEVLHGEKKGNRVSVPVVIAVEAKVTNDYSIRCGRLSNASVEQFEAFINTATDPYSVVCGFGGEGIENLRQGFAKTTEQTEHLPMSPLILKIGAQLTQHFTETYRSSVHADQLDFYLAEFEYRFNSKRSHSRGRQFYHLVKNACKLGTTST